MVVGLQLPPTGLLSLRANQIYEGEKCVVYVPFLTTRSITHLKPNLSRSQV